MIPSDILYLPGDVFVTRNGGGDEFNRTPGYFNHAAMYVGESRIVEAQQHVVNGILTEDTSQSGAVIVSDINEFWERYPIIVIYRLNVAHAVGLAAARHARDLVGTRYRRVASIFRILRHPRRGMNCVAVVRQAVAHATQRDPRWKIPDHIAESPLLRRVYSKPWVEAL